MKNKKLIIGGGMLVVVTVLVLLIPLDGFGFWGTIFRRGCVDSDGGDNIYVKGTIEGPRLTTRKKPIDYCLMDGEKHILVEYSCTDDNGFNSGLYIKNLFSKSVPCPLGCIGGACVRE